MSSHIQTAIQINNPSAQLYLWILQNIDYAKIASRTHIAVTNPNAQIKAVAFELDNHTRLPCGLWVCDAFMNLHGEELVNKLLGQHVYIRRKPVYYNDGTSRLSHTAWQVIVCWNRPFTV
jgi:hypothetical protein